MLKSKLGQILKAVIEWFSLLTPLCVMVTFILIVVSTFSHLHGHRTLELAIVTMSFICFIGYCCREYLRARYLNTGGFLRKLEQISILCWLGVCILYFIKPH